MNPEQLNGQIRLWLAVFSGIAGALGWTWFDGLAAQIMAAAGPVMALGIAVWSLLSKTKANQISAVAAMPEVKSIDLQPTVAGAVLNRATPANVQVGR